MQAIRTVIAVSTLLAAVATPLPSAFAGDGDGFRQVKCTKYGITVSRREGRTKGFFINRIETRSPVPPAALATGLWRVFENVYPPVIERKFIARSENEIVFHDKVRTPVVSDRDYTLRARRFVDVEAWRIEFETAPEAGPPPLEGYVRMPMVRGGWRVVSDGVGGSLVRYEVYTEPGGLVPALLVRDPLTDDAVGYVRRCIRDAAPARAD